MYIYLVGNTELSWYKIGVTGNLLYRVKAIQNTLPFSVSLIAHAESSPTMARVVEQETHTRFWKHHLRGEWFKGLDIVAVAAFMTEKAKGFGNA